MKPLLPQETTPNTMSLQELQAARHNAFLLMDTSTLSQIAMEATIRVDASIAAEDTEGLKAYKALMQGARADTLRLREEA